MNELLTQTDPGTPMGEYMRRFWVPCLPAERVTERDGTPVRLKIMGEELLAFRDTSGHVALIDAYCPHRCAPLFFGRNEEDGIRCVYHGWKFDWKGNCVDIPCDSHGRFKQNVKVKAYPTQEAGGLIWAYMGPSETTPELPQLEFLAVPDDHRVFVARINECNYLQAVEGDHDSSHVNFLHADLARKEGADPNSKRTFRDIQLRVIPRPEITDRDAGVVTAFKREFGNYALWRASFWLTPFYSLIAADPGGPIAVNVRVPRDDFTSWEFYFWYRPDKPIDSATRDRLLVSDRWFSPLDPRDPEGYRAIANKSNDYLVDRYVQRHETFSGIRALLDQDRAVTEGVPIIDRTKENLMFEDAAIVAIRRHLIAGANALLEGKEPPEARDGRLYTGRSVSVLLPRDVSFEEGIKSCPECETWEPQERPVDLGEEVPVMNTGGATS